MSKDETKDKVWYNEPDLEAEDKKKEELEAKAISSIDTRRQKVFDLYFNRNNTQQQVATILGVHVQTVKNDIKAIREAGAKREAEVSVDERIGEACQRKLAMIAEITYQYHAINDPSRGMEKLKYLEMLRKAIIDYDSFRMEVGLIPRAAERKEISVTTKMAREMSLDELYNRRNELVKDLLGEGSVEEILEDKVETSDDTTGNKN